MKWNVLFAVFIVSSSVHATTAVYFAYEEGHFPKQQSFWDYFTKEPIDVSLMPASMSQYLKDKALRSGVYVLRKPRFENEIVIFADGPYYATVWRSGTAIHNEAVVLDHLFHLSSLKKKFDALGYTFYRLPIYTLLNTQGGLRRFFVYQMPGFKIKAQGDDCRQFMQVVKQSTYNGDAFSCNSDYLNYIPVYSYKDVKHIGTWIK